MFFGRQVWDPQLIISQMIIMQCSYYLSLGGLMVGIDAASGVPLTIDQFFSAYAFQVTSSFGYTTVTCYLLNSLISALLLSIVVERAKKCLDFGATVLFYHLGFVWLYDGFPIVWEWWLCNGLALAISVIVGEFLCMRKELSDIPIGGNRRT